MSRPVSPTKLTLQATLAKRKYGCKVGLYKCECGRSCEAIIKEVERGKVKSCGCLFRKGDGGNK